MISAQVIARGLHKLLVSGTPQEEVFQSFQIYITQHHLQGIVPNVIHYLELFLEQAKSKQGVQISTAHDITQQTIAKILNYVNAEKNSPVIFNKNEKIVGGFIARYNDVEYDASLSAQLLRFKKAVIHTL